jgi:excisionase family DNA binding protein
MTTDTTPAGEHADGAEPQPAVPTELLDVKAIAALLCCSTRHVYRLADGGRMPRPLRLGALVRWNRSSVLSWINEGCPPVRAASGGRR